MKRTKPLKRKTPVKKRNAKRRESEFARCYHSRERVAFVKSLPCAAKSWECRGAIHNAHTATGGIAWKAAASTIAPLCATHHERFDQYRVPFNDPLNRLLIRAAAARTESLWLESQHPTRNSTDELLG